MASGNEDDRGSVEGLREVEGLLAGNPEDVTDPFGLEA
jgi:hypothetical protein